MVHSLPPGVVGGLRGELSLAVDEIVWVGEQKSSSNVRAEWWGSNKENQVIYAPVDVRNFSMCVPGGLMVHTYSVNTGQEKFGEYLSDASPLVLRLVDRVGRAEVELSLEGVEGYFPVLGEMGKEIANIHVRLNYKCETEIAKEVQENTRNTIPRPLLRSRRQKQLTSSKTSKLVQTAAHYSAIDSMAQSQPQLEPRGNIKVPRVTFRNLPQTSGVSNVGIGGTPIADSLIASLLDQSASLRASMKDQLETTQLEFDRREMDTVETEKENVPLISPELNPLLSRPTGWNLPVSRLKQLAQVKSFTTTVLSLTVQPALLVKLKQPSRSRPSFVPSSASSSRREQGSQARQQHNNIALFIKFSLPNRKESNFCSRRLVGDVAEFGETALEQIVCDTSLLDSWWGSSIVFFVFCRQFGQKDSLHLGSASIGLKHLLAGDTSLADGHIVSLPVYAAQGLFRQLKVANEFRKEVVGSVAVSFNLGSSSSSRPAVRSRTLSPQDPVRENDRQGQTRSDKKPEYRGEHLSSSGSKLNMSARQRSIPPRNADLSPPEHETDTSPPLPATLYSQPTRTPLVSVPVLGLLRVLPGPEMPTYTTMFMRWGEREVQGKVLNCVEQLLIPGNEGRIFNRQSVSRLIESCLVVEVWWEENLVGIARVATDKLAMELREWNGHLVEGVKGKVEVVGLVDGNIIGLLLVELWAGTEKQLGNVVGMDKLLSLVSKLGKKLDDKETMTSTDRETMTEWDNSFANTELKKDNSEAVTDGYDTPESVTETDMVTTEQTTVPSQSSLTEKPTTVVEHGKDRKRVLVEIMVEEGRIMANNSWVYCTLPSGQASIISQSSSPSWELVAQVMLGLEYLMDPQTQFIIRVWSSNTEQSDTNQDQMVGFAAVDLSPLLSFPLVSGWYNVINWMGKCRGHLKVTVKPFEKIPLPLHREAIIPSGDRERDVEVNTETDDSYFTTMGAYRQFPSHLVHHSEEIITQDISNKETVVPKVKNITKTRLWNPPPTNFLPPDPSLSYLETALARNLSELDLISARMTSEDKRDGSTSAASQNDTTFVVEENYMVPNTLSLSMVYNTINTNLDSLRSLSLPAADLKPRPIFRQLSIPSLHLELEGLSIEDSTEREEDSERSRIGPEGGNTDG